MFQLNVDGTKGDYFEFGVAHGNSLMAAYLASVEAIYPKLGILEVPRNIYGFDTFDGFSSHSIEDQHNVWQGSLYNHNFEKVNRRFRRNNKVHIFQVDACSLANETGIKIPHSSFGIEMNSKAALILLDMDLYAPTKSSLIWVKPLLQQGTFLMFDEFHAFSGRRNRGEKRAMLEFINENSEIEFEQIDSYGAGGKVFVTHVK
jgi:hypothetical protein